MSEAPAPVRVLRIVQLPSLALVATILVAALSFFGQWNHDLWTPDEPREAEIGRAMAASGDLLVPRLGGEPFLEKPPGYYVLLASVMRLSGSTAAGWLRMMSAWFVLGTALLTFAIARRFFAARVGLLAALILLTFELCFYDLGHRVVIDPMLMFACTLALLGCSRAIDGRSARCAGPFWLGLCLAFAAKGLVGPVLVLAAVAAMALSMRRLAFVRALAPIAGSLAFLALAALWCGLLYRRGGSSFVAEFVVHNQILRFVGGAAYGGGHQQPFYDYLRTLPVALLPWTPITLCVVAALLRPSVRTQSQFPRARVDLFLAWLLAMLLVLSVASTKRDIYLAPVLPACAVLTAFGLDSAWLLAPRLRAALLRCHVAVLAAVIALVPVALLVVFRSSWWGVAFGLVLAGAMLRAGRRHSGQPHQAFFLCVIAAVAWHEIAILAFPPLDRWLSLRPIAEQVAALVPDQDRFYGYKLDETMRAVLPFYTSKTPQNVWDEDAADQSGVARLNQLLAQRRRCQILVLERHLEQTWPRLEHPYEILYRAEKSERRVVLLIQNITTEG